MAQQTTMRVNLSPAARENRSEAQRNRRPRNAVTGEPSGEIGVTGNAPEATALIAENPTPRKGRNIFSLAASNVSKQAAAKMQTVGEIRQRLAEAKDMFSATTDENAKATELAGAAALRLYQARVSGLMSSDEVTGILGDIFGYKKTLKGELSKTPAGQGEAIRKRVVRSVAAAEHVTNGDGGRFFVGLPEDKVTSVVSRLDKGELSLYSAYDILAELKRLTAQEREKVDPAFDIKRISANVEALSKPGAKEKVLNTPGLVTAYAALIDVLLIIGERPEEEEKK